MIVLYKSAAVKSADLLHYAAVRVKLLVLNKDASATDSRLPSVCHSVFSVCSAEKGVRGMHVVCFSVVLTLL